MKIEIRHLPEKWQVNWTDSEGIEHQERFDTKEQAQGFYTKKAVEQWQRKLDRYRPKEEQDQDL
jgi:hypothetical protein